MRSNVFQVLVSNTPVSTVLAAGTVDNLVNGQIGFFDVDTNKAFVPSTATALPKAFYIAVNNNGNISFSAGQEIQSKFIYEVTGAPYSLGNSDTFTVTIPGELPCETDFAVKVEVLSQVVRQRIGTIGFSETYAGRTESCVDCDSDCPTTGNGYVTKQILNSIVQNNLGLTISYGGSVVTVQNLETVLASILDTNNTPLVITIALPQYETTPSSSVNNTYKGQRLANGVVTLLDGFSEFRLGAVAKTVSAEAGSGSGYDVKQKEYFAGGWNGRPGPYRVLQTTNLAMPGFVYNAIDGGEYDVYNLTYDQFSTSGWGEYLNNLQTTIAVPEGSDISTAIAAELLAIAEFANATALGLAPSGN